MLGGLKSIRIFVKELRQTQTKTVKNKNYEKHKNSSNSKIL